MSLHRNISALPLAGIGNDIVIVITSQGLISQISARNPDYLLASRAELLGQHYSEVVPAPIADLLREHMQRAEADSSARSVFLYPLEVRGVIHEFHCELLLLQSSEADSGFLALINLIDDYDDPTWQVRAKDRLLFAVAHACEVLISPVTLDVAINETLYLIGRGVDVDRVYLFVRADEPGSEQMLLRQQFEWCSELIEPQIDNPELQRLDISDYKEIWDLLINNKPFKAIVSQLPAGKTRDVFAAQEIKSVLLVPIFRNGDFFGILGFDDCQNERKWRGVDIAILQIYSSVVSSRCETN